jgi:CSLREA domain-containing protein
MLLNLMIVAVGATPARAASTITVNSLADTVAVDGYCTLREAIQNASNHAAINADCAAGSGGDTINFSVSGTITLGSRLPDPYDAGELTIDGTGQTVTINGNHAVQVATGGSLLTLNNLTIANGYVPAGSGGAISSSGTLIISNCTFSGNSALRGGAIYKLVGTLTITNSTFSGNTANDGGGIYNDSGTLTIADTVFSGNSVPSGDGGGIYSVGGLTLIHSTFSGNSAYLGHGGGIYKSIGDLTITDSVFSSNSANGGDGGGIYNKAGPLTITNSSFSGNSAANGLGGGIYNDYPNPLTVRGSTFSTNSAGSGGGVYNNGYAGYPSAITNSTFSGNSASEIGGGIYNNAGTLTITNSTFSGNSASGSGGGVNRTGGTFTLRNTIVGNNAGGNCSGTITNGGNNIDTGTTCGWGSASGSMSNTNPLLGALTGSPAYFPLEADSPAIDKGEDSICAVWPVNNESQNGLTRPQGPHCDIGSYEYRGSIFADVPLSYWASTFIERLYLNGVTGGCSTNPLNYCPNANVTRAQMAVFLLKGRHGAAYTPPAATGAVFADVPANYWAAAWIEQLQAEGITGGCGNGKYCPETPVTRDQMAVFLLRAKHGNTYVPPAATGVFVDVPTNYWAADWIEQLAAEGITSGCGGGKYCPAATVTRAQMAVFLVTTFNLP